MRLNYAFSLITLATAASTQGFHVANIPATATRTSTRLAERRSMFPTLRRGDRFFPDIDRMFQEMDEMMTERSLASGLSLPSLRGIKDATGVTKLKRPLGFEITQDENDYKVSVHIPDVEAKDVALQLDHDGRVLRLTGERTHEEGGMKVHSRFEKAILLNPDVDTTKLAANMAGDTLTVVAPKIEKEAALAKAENKKIEITQMDAEAPKATLPTEQMEELKAALQTDQTDLEPPENSQSTPKSTPKSTPLFAEEEKKRAGEFPYWF